MDRKSHGFVSRNRGDPPPEVAWVLCRRASGRASAVASLLHHILKNFPSEGDSRRTWS